MKKSEWLDCQGNEFFPKQKGTPSLVKIEHENTATLDSAKSKKKSKVAVLQLGAVWPGLILFASLINLYDSNWIYIPLGTALSGPAWFAH